MKIHINKNIETLFLESKYLTAINILKVAIKKNPNDHNALILLGFAHDQQANVLRKTEAKNYHFRKAIEAFNYLHCLGYQSEALRGLGTVFLHQGKFTKAEKFFQTSYRKNPQDPKTLVALGNAARQLGKYSLALEWYKKYRLSVGTDWQIIVNETLTAREAGKLKLAKRKAIVALKMWPKTNNSRILNTKKVVQEIAKLA